MKTDIPFDWIIADVLDKHGSFEFILTEPAPCPSCHRPITEKTLIEPWVDRVDILS
jgi:hypothetical protein